MRWRICQLFFCKPRSIFRFKFKLQNLIPLRHGTFINICSFSNWFLWMINNFHFDKCFYLCCIIQILLVFNNHCRGNFIFIYIIIQSVSLLPAHSGRQHWGRPSLPSLTSTWCILYSSIFLNIFITDWNIFCLNDMNNNLALCYSVKWNWLSFFNNRF